jgi:sec-independent protein translocase protein TatA
MPLGTPEIIIIVVVILLLFGGKKIPELMRGLGRGVKEFKDASNNSSSDNVTTVHTDEGHTNKANS